jgi:hypothetical protein
MKDMEVVLKQINLVAHISSFEREKITPDIVSKLSLNEMRLLGIIHSADIVKLRVECLKFGNPNMKFQKRNESASDFRTPSRKRSLSPIVVRPKRVKSTFVNALHMHKLSIF